MFVKRAAATVTATAAVIAMTSTAVLADPTHGANADGSTLGIQTQAHSVWRVTAVPDVYYQCSGTPNTSSRKCKFKALYNGTPIISPGGRVLFTAPAGDIMQVTCYYYGNPPSGFHSDGIEDHIDYLQTDSNITSDHVPDYYVAEGGKVPYQAPYDIVECG